MVCIGIFEGFTPRINLFKTHVPFLAFLVSTSNQILWFFIRLPVSQFPADKDGRGNAEQQNAKCANGNDSNPRIRVVAFIVDADYYRKHGQYCKGK